jgi:hypothetical protein
MRDSSSFPAAQPVDARFYSESQPQFLFRVNLTDRLNSAGDERHAALGRSLTGRTGNGPGYVGKNENGPLEMSSSCINMPVASKVCLRCLLVAKHTPISGHPHSKCASAGVSAILMPVHNPHPGSRTSSRRNEKAARGDCPYAMGPLPQIHVSSCPSD